MAKGSWIMWQGLLRPSLERCVLQVNAPGYRLSGLILCANSDDAYLARYAIELDQDWRTQTVEVELESAAVHRLTIEHQTTGAWLVNGESRTDLNDCLDIDLEWTPATNTIPIRRLAIPFRGVETVTAAWVRFPSLAIEPLEQSYERLSEHAYRYRAGDFTADLEVDQEGLVTRYGSAWQAVARGTSS